MRKLLLATTALLALTGAARADTLLDPLHFSCTSCGADNGTVTPTNGPATGISVVSSPPGATGDLTLFILLPNNDTLLTSDAITGTINGTSINFTATDVKVTAWTSGDFENNFLGQAMQSPPNPISAWLPTTQAADPGATGYWVLSVDLGQVDLSKALSINVAAEDIGGIIFGELKKSDGSYITTAQSAALEINQLAPPVPEISTWAMMLLGFAGVGLFGMRGRVGSRPFRMFSA